MNVQELGKSDGVVHPYFFNVLLLPFGFVWTVISFSSDGVVHTICGGLQHRMPQDLFVLLQGLWLHD